MTGSAPHGESARNVEGVLRRVEAAARRAGRNPSEVTVIGVTKTVAADRVRDVVAAGVTHLGENRVQEAAEKIAALADLREAITWHLIGHLQANKAGRAAELFDWVQSVDGADLARRLNKRASERGVTLDVLIQVDLGHEPTKHGVDAGLVAGLLEQLGDLSHLAPRGLMTIPPAASDPELSRPFFRRLKALKDELAAAGRPLEHLSMGMSDDFEVAIEEGATMVRVGRALFGQRPAMV
ncbi:MAG TPA: YggS family pyridoxal phosphate-dependent enzyme [Candidatus Polarisedimenticolia bacterium]|nr:YggS family pyridoxal phosphate-dependent enzyme [Candidatus Polarisedimenticolia bacterium]